LSSRNVHSCPTRRSSDLKEETGAIYGKRKIDVEPVFGFLKANLCFTRMSVRGKEKVENEIGFAFMAVNLRKYTAMKTSPALNHPNYPNRKGVNHQIPMIDTFFQLFWLVLSQPPSSSKDIKLCEMPSAV